MNTIETTLGRVTIDQLGRVNAHDHVVIEGDLIARMHPDFIHCEIDEISTEIEEWKLAGGGAIIDCSPIDAGRNAAKLEEISRRTHLPIIVCTGFHTSNYYSQNHWVFSKTREEIAEVLFQECFTGIVGNNVRGDSTNHKNSKAGVIKIGVDETGMNPHLIKLLQASIDLVRGSRIPLMLHTTPGVPFETLADWFNNNHIPPEKILFCHMDKVSDFSVHQFLTDKGFMIEYDALIREKPGLENLAQIIKKEIRSGMGSQILFGGDMARITYWKSYGGEPGMAFMLNDATDRLVGNGIQPEELEKIWIENPKRWLD